jgi:uncharacterized membrane protein YadS
MSRGWWFATRSVPTNRSPFWDVLPPCIRGPIFAAASSQDIPKFVLGFLLISLLATVGFFTKPQLAAVGNLSRWAFLLTFAGVGLRTNLRELSKQGARPLIVGGVGEIVIALITLGLVFGADHWYHL